MVKRKTGGLRWSPVLLINGIYLGLQFVDVLLTDFWYAFFVVGRQLQQILCAEDASFSHRLTTTER